MRTIPGWLFFIVVGASVVATVACAVIGYGVAQQVALDAADAGIDTAMVSFDLFAQQQPTSTPTATPAPTNTAAPTNTPEPGVTFTPAPTATIDPMADIPELADPSRRTILLMGIDERTGFTDEQAYRSDTLMLVHIDPIQKRVGILSIPRDMYVSIPGFTQNQRINTANYSGDLNDYPGGGGPALAAETIRDTFGIRVDNYVRINFDVFTVLVDTLAPNGIEVCPTEVIDDPKYPDEGFGTRAIRFEPGCQRLDAERLLQYARTRATQGGDFDRARRQQEVLKAAQAEFLSLGGITNFIGQIPTVYSALSDSIRTDLTLDELIGLARLAGEIPQENITTGVIDNRYVTLAKDPTGADILIPNIGAVRGLIQEIFNPQPPKTLAELRILAEQENATIAVYNSTNIGGLATQTRDWLASQQVNVASVGNMPVPDEGLLRIRDYTGKRWTARYLAALMGIPEERIEVGSDGLVSQDILVVVGTDIQPLLAPPTAAP
ncbi:MAG: LCP family protein [Anaerolineae bacterium]|jgi:LCP family protein required for cell wall assembly|nr:LCP family protein [Anaerolineae bacterium]